MMIYDVEKEEKKQNTLGIKTRLLQNTLPGFLLQLTLSSLDF